MQRLERVWSVVAAGLSLVLLLEVLVGALDGSLARPSVVLSILITGGASFLIQEAALISERRTPAGRSVP